MSDVSDLKAEVLALRAENAELRKHVKMPDEPLEIDEKDFYVRAFIKWATEEQPEVKRLEAENAKLRELVRDMAAVICVYDQCGTVDDCPPALPMFTDKMRELGIEVDA